MHGKSKIYINYVGNLASGLPDDVLLVEKEADYVRACHTLLQRRDSGTVLKIWVRLKPYYTWLQSFTEQIACPASFEEKTPRLILAEKWNVEMPDWLKDNDILEHNLLQIEVDSGEPVCLEECFLSHFLGAVFNTGALKPGDVAAVIKSLVSLEAKTAFKEQPLLQRCLMELSAVWAKNAVEPWLKEFCSRLSDDLGGLWHGLSAWSILRGYPDKLLEYVLPPAEVIFVRDIPPGLLGDLLLETGALEQALTQIELFFAEIEKQVSTSSEFQKIVERTSGCLTQEYQFATNILRSGRFEPAESDIRTLREKFEFCPGVSQNQLNSLHYLIKPVRPVFPGPEEKWSVAEWMEWTVDEYTPYRAWQVHNKHHDSDLEEAVVCFSDWYVCEYLSIHKELDLSLAYCLADLAKGTLNDDLNIILLIDCLPLHYVEIVNNALWDIDLSRKRISYRLAGLPTVTANNKPFLLAGNWQEDARDYEAILKKRAATEWGGKKVIYLSNLKAMAEMKAPQEAAIIVLNLLDADEILHSDLESKNVAYEDELYRLFQRVAAEVNRLLKEWSGGKEFFNVYVVTDHGACRILEDEKKSFDSKIVKKLFPDEKYRFAAVDEEQADDIPQNLWEIGYRFKQPFRSESPVYFIPRGHNTVRQAGAVKGYTHGGATPEEVIVPMMLYKPVKVSWEKPRARFLNLDLDAKTNRAWFYIQRIVTIEIEIQNPNTVKINIQRVSIISPAADLKNFETVAIPPGKAKRLKMDCYFKKPAAGEKTMTVELAYEIAGEKHILSLLLKSEFRTAQRGGFRLKEL